MVFSSAVFLFYFLPLTILCVGSVRLLARGERFVRLRNLIRLCASCVCYAWGEASLTLLLLLFAWINYRLALGLSASYSPVASNPVPTALEIPSHPTHAYC